MPSRTIEVFNQAPLLLPSRILTIAFHLFTFFLVATRIAQLAALLLCQNNWIVSTLMALVRASNNHATASRGKHNGALAHLHNFNR